jgi:hypothetical protein
MSNHFDFWTYSSKQDIDEMKNQLDQLNLPLEIRHPENPMLIQNNPAKVIEYLDNSINNKRDRLDQSLLEIERQSKGSQAAREFINKRLKAMMPTHTNKYLQLISTHPENCAVQKTIAVSKFADLVAAAHQGLPRQSQSTPGLPAPIVRILPPHHSRYANNFQAKKLKQE